MAETKAKKEKAVDMQKTVRVTLRMTQANHEKLKYWAAAGGYDVNEFVIRLLERYVDIENGNYQLPTLEARRLNQLIESQTAMSLNLQSLEQIITSGFDSLLGLTRGDNYLLEQTDEGE